MKIINKNLFLVYIVIVLFSVVLLNLISKDSNKYSLTKDNKFIYKFIESDANKRRNNVNLLLDEIL